MDEIVGEASGETAFNHVMAMCGFPRDRKSAEYAGTFAEAQYVLDRLKDYGLAEAAILRYPGGETWDGVKGELWEVKPGREKIASYRDLTAMLASGSASADVTAELVWVEEGEAKDFEGLDVKGKVLLTSGSAGAVHNLGCLKNGAAGVISFASPRPLFDPLIIPWGGLYGRGGAAETKFAFLVPPREGVILRDRLKGGEKITVRAVVEAKTEKADFQDIVAAIPGTDADAEEVIVTAHIFEGYAMFGANDNSSGSAAILEAARALQALIAEGRLPRPKRTIRFLWAPEFSGTIPYVKAEAARMARTLCDINLDMVGGDLARNLGFFTVMRTTYGNPHYVNDVVENYFRYVGEATRSYVTNGMDEEMNRRIVAPSGSEQPMYYYVGTHFGSSDHEVFNDWAVGVPGVVLNTWPDKWYHTSEDRPDKLDPTQMKRAVIITAASAYTIAAADDALAARIAAEIVSNASARMGHQLARGLEEMERTDAAAFPAVFKRARGYVQAAARNERATLDSVAELAAGQDRLRPRSDRAQGLGLGLRGGPPADDGPGHAPASRGAQDQARRPPALAGREESGRAHPQAPPQDQGGRLRGLSGRHPGGQKSGRHDAGPGAGRAGRLARRRRDPAPLRRPEQRPGHQEDARHPVPGGDGPRGGHRPPRIAEEGRPGRFLGISAASARPAAGLGELPERSRRNDGHGPDLVKLEDLRIPRDEYLRLPVPSGGKKDPVRPIPDRDLDNVRRFRKLRPVAKQGDKPGNEVGGSPDLFGEDGGDLIEQGRGDHEVVTGQDFAHHVGAQPACRRRGDDDIGVEEDFQETREKTSSSVR